MTATSGSSRERPAPERGMRPQAAADREEEHICVHRFPGRGALASRGR